MLPAAGILSNATRWVAIRRRSTTGMPRPAGGGLDARTRGQARERQAPRIRSARLLGLQGTPTPLPLAR